MDVCGQACGCGELQAFVSALKCKYNKCLLGFLLVKMDFRVCGEI